MVTQSQFLVGKEPFLLFLSEKTTIQIMPTGMPTAVHNTPPKPSKTTNPLISVVNIFIWQIADQLNPAVQYQCEVFALLWRVVQPDDWYNPIRCRTRPKF